MTSIGGRSSDEERQIGQEKESYQHKETVHEETAHEAAERGRAATDQ